MKRKNAYSTAKAIDSVDSLWMRIDQIEEEIAAYIDRKRKEKQVIYEEIKLKLGTSVNGQNAASDTKASPYTKTKFGTAACDLDLLYQLFTTDYKVILPMDIADFKMAFSGLSDPKTPIICLNVSLFINVLHWMQAKQWLSFGTLNTAVYDQCLNRKGKKIPPHNIEEEFSKSRNQESRLITDAIIQKLRPR